jgi:hypothetical protein
MTQLQEYALIQNNQIIRTEWFKRPTLVPVGDWRVIGEVVPEFNSTTHRLGEKMLGILESGAVAYVWSIVALPPPPVRQRVTNAALEIALEQLGLLETVESFVEQLRQQAPRAPAVILWRKATEFRRSDALWDFFASQLNMTSEDVDNIFNLAGQIDDSFNNTWE